MQAFFEDFDRVHAAARKPTEKEAASTFIGPSEPTPGVIIGGRYKLIENIGEGGMGSVWVAEQQRPLKRKVAIKLIKPGMDSKQVLARFEAERQDLAVMDHPNIAKVFDGGMTDQGRPFFVMEYVKGVPFTEYCDRARLSLRERLTLFIPVCSAVQHAHQKGIVHRDLKPSNIMVCLEELTFDYETTDVSMTPFECRCGAKQCRGRIDGSAWNSPEFQANNAGWLSPYIAARMADGHRSGNR